MIIYAAAKVNLCLDILQKDRNGYHQIQTVLHELPNLRNRIEIRESKEKEQKSTAENLANRAIHLLKKAYGTVQAPLPEVTLSIERNILPGSGLGGESSNAAAVLKALNQLWKLNLSRTQLLELAAQLGMDVPFFIIGGTALATHYGELITALPSPGDLHISVNQLRSKSKNKTQEAYNSLNLAKCGQNKHKTDRLVEILKAGDKDAIKKELASLIHNDFSSTVHLCGSGPSTFTLEIAS
ncbi:4-(cytidine 5'-diphospho)-2-C-methyl-D-erythritol kinase [Candidatus Peregrinibacteria bacterium]|nr:4-(cytidine 5'-diphospho)-2-C-methyl-D-erythritol kinase [Candidatus Peregrinibacteria bacterium]